MTVAVVIVAAAVFVLVDDGRNVRAQEAPPASEAPTPTPIPTPVVGTIHTSGCVWVENSYTEIFGAVFGAHRRLFPLEMVRDKLRSGFREDGTVHKFQWYDSSGQLHKRMGQNAVDLYVRHYSDMRSFFNVDRFGAYRQFYAPDGSAGFAAPNLHSRDSSILSHSVKSGIGEEWAYVFYGFDGEDDELYMRGGPVCVHILPDSTPDGHEAYFVEASE